MYLMVMYLMNFYTTVLIGVLMYVFLCNMFYIF